VRVRVGDKLNQLRFVRGHPATSDSWLAELDRAERLVYLPNDVPQAATIDNGLWISVDLKGADDTGITGYKARLSAPVIDLQRVGYYDPLDFWEPILRPRNGEIILNPGEFYILASRERIRVPPSAAAELVGYDPSVGEFRIHYAGFFDPGFGYREDQRGTQAVLEVRSHEVPFLLQHGQRVGRFIYEPLLELPEKLYGPAIGSSYQRQRVALSKHFKGL
jgi:dCTP deaminase